MITLCLKNIIVFNNKTIFCPSSDALIIYQAMLKSGEQLRGLTNENRGINFYTRSEN